MTAIQPHASEPTAAADAREHIWKSYPLLGFKAATDKAGTFSGYASTWAKDSYGDKILPGAFGQSIADKKGQIPIFFNHDSDNWIGFSTTLAEDSKGLLLEAGLALESSSAADVFALLKMADDIGFRVGLSIGFIADDWEWDEDTGGRIIKAIDLWETSITPFPANKRAYIDDVKHIRNFEKRLRDVGGYSTVESKRIVSLLQPFAASGLAAQPLAPARDVREVQTTQATPTSGIREELWQQLLNR